jgi:hypothetical protein
MNDAKKKRKKSATETQKVRHNKISYDKYQLAHRRDIQAYTEWTHYESGMAKNRAQKEAKTLISQK